MNVTGPYYTHYNFKSILDRGDAVEFPDKLYLAVNIVGLVEAADIGKSVIDPTSGDTMTSVDFDSLAVDETKAHGQLMFRLAENITAVLVHRKVREQIEAAGITSLTWFDPEEWAG